MNESVIKTRFFNCKQGDIIVVKNSTLNKFFVNALVGDLLNADRQPLLLAVNGCDNKTCRARKIEKSFSSLIEVLDEERHTADVFIVDSLDVGADIEDIISKAKEIIKGKVFIIFCYVSHLPTKPDGHANYKFVATERQLKEEKTFNERCLARGVSGIYELHVYTRFGGAVINLVNSLEKESKTKLRIDYVHNELTTYNTAK